MYLYVAEPGNSLKVICQKVIWAEGRRPQTDRHSGLVAGDRLLHSIFSPGMLGSQCSGNAVHFFKCFLLHTGKTKYNVNENP